MCAAVVVPSKPENVASTRMVLSTSSIVIVARPVPGEALGGASFGPLRLAVYWMIVAWANDVATSIVAAITGTSNECFMKCLLSCIGQGLAASTAHVADRKYTDEKHEARIEIKKCRSF